MGQNFTLDLVADSVLQRAMRTIIAGSRWIPQSYVLKVLDQLPPDRQPTTILSGGGGSVDRAGEVWATIRGIPVEIYQAEWEKYGRRAGPIRNQAMVDHADALIAVWDGKSRGTAHCIRAAMKRGLVVTIHIPPEEGTA